MTCRFCRQMQRCEDNIGRHSCSRDDDTKFEWQQFAGAAIVVSSRVHADFGKRAADSITRRDKSIGDGSKISALLPEQHQNGVFGGNCLGLLVKTTIFVILCCLLIIL